MNMKTTRFLTANKKYDLHSEKQQKKKKKKAVLSALTNKPQQYHLKAGYFFAPSFYEHSKSKVPLAFALKIQIFLIYRQQ